MRVAVMKSFDLIKKIFTKARKEENTKEKINFALSNFRVFVINPLNT